ncbi:PAS domain-containing sensor histidine kinase [Haloglomus litoreum]|uniref:sensor histidine kinase n=1 Tax=Haloglomus litoreum TaxID=3034026 RepID=UPI0023E7A4FA|nr:PAS domain-containing sensor histidine kinase [Haloglomus sp. DT116]
MEGSFFRDLVARSRDAIITIDSDSTIVFANEGVERTLGYDPTALEGERLTDVMPERYREPHLDALERYVSDGGRELDWSGIELPALHADGHEVPLSIAFEEHEYDGERVFSGIMRDISDRIEREDALERKNDQLERFAAVVTHDLRDPLNTARATLTLLEAVTEGRENAAEYVQDLESALDRMDALIEGVLMLTRSGRAVGEPQSVDLGTVAERAWETAGGKDASLELRAEGATLEADPERLRALLENLFRNSVEHGSTEGRTESADSAEQAGAGQRPPSVEVTVGLLGEADEEAATDDGGSPPDPTGFYVADDGRGIPEAEREAVFERGHTTTDEGTGIGLSIVRTIAEAHGWEVHLTESDAGGARFEFHLSDG